jgi:hypothetical protein
VFGAIVNNIWSIGSPPGDSDRTNQLFLNPFVNYHFAEGWSVGSSPEITANWIASGGKWTVPVGGGFGNAFHLGGQAMKLDFNAFYNAIRPKSRQRHVAAAGQADVSISELGGAERWRNVVMRGACLAREPGIQEHGPARSMGWPVFMGSGPAPGSKSGGVPERQQSFCYPPLGAEPCQSLPQ